MDSKRRAPSYVCIPRHVVANPPIKHRHTTDSEWHLTPFQFAVGCAVLNIARAVLADDLHNRALERGAKAIAKEVATGESYFEQLKMLRAKGYNGKARLNTIKSTGQAAYAHRLQVLRRLPPPEVITIEVSRYGLLTCAKLYQDRNQRKLVDAALNRLSRPVGGGEKSLVVDWEEAPNKKLLIQVSGQWLQPPYVPVATPLPRTPTAMALYLFLHSIETNNSYSRTDSSMIGLCERLGVPTRFGNAVASQLLDRALKSVNEHIKRLDHDELEKLGIKVPLYEIRSRGGRVQFVAVAWQPPPLERVQLSDEEKRMETERAGATL